MKCNIIVAMCKYNNGIGLNGSMPWNIKEDMQYFSTLTKGNGNNAVIMGANTYKSLNMYGLKERDNFILSSNLKIDIILKNSKDEISKYIVKTFNNIDMLLETCKANNYETVWIIGGSTIYREFLNRNFVNKCYITLIHKLFACDTTFPFNVIMNDWAVEKKTDLVSDKYDFKIEYVVYKKY
jgi:dihydrofolate reductase